MAWDADFAYSEGRDRAWSNIATCHEHCTAVYGWKFFNHVKTELKLVLPDVAVDNNYALCCDVNSGGETCVVGYSDGTIGMWARADSLSVASTCSRDSTAARCRARPRRASW